MIESLFPIIATRDLPRLLGFYRDLLGGTVSYEFPGPDGETVYCGLDVGTSHLGIGFDPSDAAASAPGATGATSRSMSLWVYVTDCDAVVERLRSAGATVTAEPADQPWGERVARVLDPDGNEVIIGAR